MKPESRTLKVESIGEITISQETAGQRVKTKHSLQYLVCVCVRARAFSRAVSRLWYYCHKSDYSFLNIQKLKLNMYTGK